MKADKKKNSYIYTHKTVWVTLFFTKNARLTQTVFALPYGKIFFLTTKEEGYGRNECGVDKYSEKKNF